MKRVYKGTHPGGCVIGARPIDLHLESFRELGVDLQEFDGEVCRKIQGQTSGVPGGMVRLRYPSVGATENLMMVAVFCRHEVRILNAAREPEIVDLQKYLNACGAMVYGAGTSVITVKGVRMLRKNVNHCVLPDRIETGTYLLAGALSGERVSVGRCCSMDVRSLTSLLQRCGCEMDIWPDEIFVRKSMLHKRFVSPGTVRVEPHPGFPTDLQAPVTTLLTLVQGVTTITESVFEDRFKHVTELKKMGAHIRQEGNRAVVSGVPDLSGAQVNSSDLRCGAALLLAGLAADGHTVVEDPYFIQRGYADVVGKFQAIGADIWENRAGRTP